MRPRNQRKHGSALSVVSLFTGTGGLDLGLEAAGFSNKLCVEIDEDARRTLQENRPGWRLADPGDIHRIKPAEVLAQAGLKQRELTLLAGGAPCQPFSKAAYWTNGGPLGLRDPRSKTLHAFFSIVEACLPQVLLLENVQGIAFNGRDAGVVDLFRRKLQAINRRQGTEYQLQVIHLNAADYGVPQKRERIFIMASIDGNSLTLPAKRHSDEQDCEPYRTAWDAIGELDGKSRNTELNPTGKWAGLLRSVPEGHNYLWHTERGGGEPLFGWRTRYWSFLLKLAKNQPSWTIQAEPGPATGPFHWTSRLLSIEELARLQTFPSNYKIVGDRRSAHRQLGNAVPSAIGELMGLEIRRQLLGERVRDGLKLIPAHREDCPRPERRGKVPRRYYKLRGADADHPGPGRGPAAQTRETTI